MADTITTTEVKDQEAHVENSAGLLTPDATMVLFTWATFFLLLGILHKFAWKPILAALENREETIRNSLDHAEKVRRELEQINETRDKIIHEAQTNAKEIINDSRKAASNAARAIENKAKEEAQITFENSEREIKAQFDKARSDLKEESAEVAVELAGKIIGEDLDAKKREHLIKKLIREI